MTLNGLRARGALALAGTAIIIAIAVLAADLILRGGPGGASLLAGAACCALLLGSTGWGRPSAISPCRC